MTISPNREARAKDAPNFAIALLIDLAQRGEIDPWDVQVIDAIDRCLQELANRVGQGLLEADLSQSGQAFLDASLLVWLKANTLERLEAPEEEVSDSLEEAESLEFEDGDPTRLPLHLERRLRRRPTAMPPQNRPVTLQELIDQLQLVAAAFSTETPRSRRHSSPSNAQARAQMRAALELASQENLSETAEELERFLLSYWSGQTQEQDWLDLDQLLALWSQARATVASELPSPLPVEALTTIPTAAQLHDRVGVFWSLLLLSAQSKVELAQEEFYQDLKIRAL
jgi:segregation and condensation protein A